MRHRGHRRDESITPSRQRLDETRLRARIIERPTELVNRLVHAVIGVHKDVVRPQTCAHLLTAHDGARLLEKHREYLERLALE